MPLRPGRPGLELAQEQRGAELQHDQAQPEDRYQPQPVDVARRQQDRGPDDVGRAQQDEEAAALLHADGEELSWSSLAQKSTN